MEKKSSGAWLISHTNKLQDVKDHEFEDIELAGKCGIFLSNLAASHHQSELDASKVAAIAKISGIKKTELGTVKQKLKDSHLIDDCANGSIAVLGLTTSTVLAHTADIFTNSDPSKFELAALDLAESISDLPKSEKEAKEFVSDSYKLSGQITNELFVQAEHIGFVDYENLERNSKIYFNGNLFRRDTIKKTEAILNTLNHADRTKIIELDEMLSNFGCVSLEHAIQILGKDLMPKLQAIAMYDFNEVSNSSDSKVFVTKPAAFAKFGNPFADDAFDLAKAFVSSLYYGMTQSSTERGQITMLSALLRRLINGGEVGPATAIGEDYRILEFKRVIQLRHAYDSRYYMKLLKKDIGELALQVLEQGGAAEQAVLNTLIQSGSVTDYKGPEMLRQNSRKRQGITSKQTVANFIRTFRN